jgi:hypothetical protein
MFNLGGSTFYFFTDSLFDVNDHEIARLFAVHINTTHYLFDLSKHSGNDCVVVRGVVYAARTRDAAARSSAEGTKCRDVALFE